MGALSLVKTHRALLCTVIKIIRHFDNFLEIYSHSVFYNFLYFIFYIFFIPDSKSCRIFAAIFLCLDCLSRGSCLVAAVDTPRRLSSPQ